MFNIYIYLIILSFYTMLCFSQNSIPTKEDVVNAIENKELNAFEIFKQYKKWEAVSIYIYSIDHYNVFDSTKKIFINNTDQINYITTGKIVYLKNNIFKTYFGDKYKYAKKYRVINIKDKFLILQSKRRARLFIDHGKLIYKLGGTDRYVWKMRD